MDDAAAGARRPETALPAALHGAAQAPATGPVRSGDPGRDADPFDPRIEHRVGLIDRGPFAVAVCSGCGWQSFARRSRGLARSEGRDHELLHPAS
jgi:hypothetical protein